MSADPELLPEHSETAKGQVTFDNVCFSYTKDRPLIRNFSLDVPAGCRVAIVGPTGCGKTTMINLLMRFYDPDSGSISVDGTNTQTIPRRALRRNFGMVLQETWLKTGTVLDNIRMGRRTLPKKTLSPPQRPRTHIVLLSSCRTATIRRLAKTAAAFPPDRNSFCASRASC